MYALSLIHIYIYKDIDFLYYIQDVNLFTAGVWESRSILFKAPTHKIFSFW